MREFDSAAKIGPARTFVDFVSSFAMVVCGVLLVVFLFAFGSWAWMFRDGFGPDSITTHGADAINQTFWQWNFGPISLILIAIYLVFMYGQLRHLRRTTGK